MGSGERDIYVHLPWAVFEIGHTLDRCSEQSFRCNFSCMKKDGKRPSVAACNVRVYRDVWDIVTLQASGIDDAVSPLSESCHFYLSDFTTNAPREGVETCDEEDHIASDVSNVDNDVSQENCDHEENPDEDAETKIVKTDQPSLQHTELAHHYNTRRKERLVWTAAMTPLTKATTRKTDTNVTSKIDVKATYKRHTKADLRTERVGRKKLVSISKSTPKMTNKCNATVENTEPSEVNPAEVENKADRLEANEDDEIDVGRDGHIATSTKLVDDDESEKCELCHKYLKNTRSLYHHILWSHKTHPLSKTYKAKVSESLYLECDVCNKKVFGESGLVQHMQRVHKQMKKVKCLVCDAMLKNKQTMIDHLRKTHKLNSRERFLRFGTITKVCPKESLQIRKKLKIKRANRLEEQENLDESLDKSGTCEGEMSEMDTSLVSNESTNKSDENVHAGLEVTMESEEIKNDVSSNSEQSPAKENEPIDGTATEQSSEINNEAGSNDSNKESTKENEQAAVGEVEMERVKEQPPDITEENESPPDVKRVRLNLSEEELEKYVMNPKVRLGRRAEQNVCCPLCKRWLKSAYSVYCHMSAEHRDHPNLGAERKAMYEKCRTQCADCGKYFGNVNLYKHHHRRFHAQEAFQPKKCDICNATCRNAMCLKEHIAKHHVQHRNVCGQCGATFPKKHQLRTHEHIKHSLHPELEDKIYKFRCEYCDRRFYANTSYQKHLNAHTGNKPHLCDHCGRAFSSTDALKRHRAKVHLVAADGSELEQPQRGQYVCQMCEQMFAERTLLNEHMNTVHHIQQRYLCNDCDQRFYSSDELKCHLEETHAMICSLCNTTIAGPNALNQHLLQVHNAQEVILEEGAMGGEEMELNEVAVYVPSSDMLGDNVVVLCTMDPDNEAVATETVVMDTEGASVSIDASETVALAAVQSGITQVDEGTVDIKTEESAVQ